MNHSTLHPLLLTFTCSLALGVTACATEDGGRDLDGGFESMAADDGSGKADDQDGAGIPGFLDVLPPVVRIHRSTGTDEPHCLGTLIGCNTVLTAAHCIGRLNDAVASGKQPTAHAEWYSQAGDCGTLAETDLSAFMERCHRVQEIPLDMNGVEVTDDYFVANPYPNGDYPDAAIIRTAAPLESDLLVSGLTRDAGYCSDPARAPFVAFPPTLRADAPDQDVVGYAVSWRVDGPEVVRDRSKQLQRECLEHFYSIETNLPDVWSNSMGAGDPHYLYMSARPCGGNLAFTLEGDSGGPLLGAGDPLYAMSGDRLMLYGILHGARSPTTEYAPQGWIATCKIVSKVNPLGVIDVMDVCRNAVDFEFDAYSSLLNPALQTWAAQRYSALEGADWR